MIGAISLLFVCEFAGDGIAREGEHRCRVPDALGVETAWNLAVWMMVGGMRDILVNHTPLKREQLASVSGLPFLVSGSRLWSDR